MRNSGKTAALMGMAAVMAAAGGLGAIASPMGMEYVRPRQEVQRVTDIGHVQGKRAKRRWRHK